MHSHPHPLALVTGWKRIKEAQLNGDSSLSENSKRFRAILPDGKVSMID
jgi:hypothetical protein